MAFLTTSNIFCLRKPPSLARSLCMVSLSLSEFSSRDGWESGVHKVYTIFKQRNSILSRIR